MAKRLLYSQQNLQGLVNGQGYAIKPDGSLVALPSGLINATYGQLYAAGLTLGNGIYTFPTDAQGKPDAGALQMLANTGGQTMVSLAGGIFGIGALLTPPDAAGNGPTQADKACYGRASVALASGMQTQVVLPLLPASGVQASDTVIAGWACPRYFFAFVFANTYPSAGGIFQCELSWI